jgi:hypothetical protein
VPKTSESTSASKSTTKARGADAIAMLTKDHDNVKKMFKEYEKLKDSGSSEEKAALAAQICLELAIHAQVEEELFYPEVREAIDDDDLMNEAEVEHASAKDLIAQISGMDPDDEMFDATVKVLSEYVDHHVKEEENEMFAKAKKAKVDVETLGQAIEVRKEELMAEMAGEEAEEAPSTPKAKGRSGR